MKAGERVVLITGATGGLGRAAARSFATTGDRLALNGRSQTRIDDLAASAGLGAERWMPVVADLRDRDQARAAVAAVEERFGRIDVLLHLVGGWVGGVPVADLDHDELRSMLDQHLWTTLNVAQAAVPGMVQRGWGRVVAVSSPLAMRPGPGGASYAVGKAAEETLLGTLAREVAGSGVTVNTVTVRTIDVDHLRETDPTPKNAAHTTPEEATASIQFLASDDAAAINGARLPLYGRG
jgi:NAD(P)-dependent dehydrogenase (short-subunit alcohol dehydrogenase family)